MNALAALFKVSPAYLSFNPDAPSVDPTIMDSINKIAGVSDSRSFRDNLSQNGFTLFKSENEYFILSFKMKVIVNAKDCGVGESLLEPQSQGKQISDGDINVPGLFGGIGMDVSSVLPDNPLEKTAQVIEDILSIGDTSGGIGGGGPKNISKKKKRKDDKDQEGRGHGY